MEEMEVEKEEAQNSMSNFETQLDAYDFAAPQAGQLVEGTVVQVTDDYVYVDIGDKSEGLIARNEFTDELPKEGDKVQALLTGHNAHGPVLSKRKADSKKYLKEIQNAWKEKTAVDGTIIKVVNSGFEVDLGIDKMAFLPISQADVEKIDKPESLIGVRSKFYVERLRVYASGENLFAITGFSGMDPEMRVSMGYSTMRQYAFGINLTF